MEYFPPCGISTFIEVKDPNISSRAERKHTSEHKQLGTGGHREEKKNPEIPAHMQQSILG